MGEVADLTIAVEKHLWHYLKDSKVFQEELAEISGKDGVSVDLKASENELLLAGTDQKSVGEAHASLTQLIKDYQDRLQIKNVNISDAAVLSSVANCPAEFQTGAYLHVDPHLATVCIVGTPEEVAYSERKILQKNVVVESIESGDQLLVEFDPVSESGQENAQNDSQVVQVDSDLWDYMLKHDAYKHQIDFKEEKVRVEVIKSEAVGDESPASIQLIVSGLTDDVSVAVKTTVDLIEKCKINTKTQRIPCPDARVLNKITKNLKALNKKGLVSTSDNVVFITGTESELADCRGKLERIGLTFHDQPSAAAEIAQVPNEKTEQLANSWSTGVGSPSAELRHDETTGKPDFGSFKEVPSSSSDRMQIEKDAAFAADLERAESSRQSLGGFERGLDRFGSEFSDGSGGAADDIYLETFLWKYVERRRKSKLLQVKDVMGLQINALEVPGGLMKLHLRATSQEMLELGRSALQELLLPLQETIAHVDLGTQQELPPQLKQIIEQKLEGSDVVVTFSPSQIIIIGPVDEVNAGQRQIAEFFQQLAAQTQSQGVMPGQFEIGGGRRQAGDLSMGMPMQRGIRPGQFEMGGGSRQPGDLSMGMPLQQRLAGESIRAPIGRDSPGSGFGGFDEAALGPAQMPGQPGRILGQLPRTSMFGTDSEQNQQFPSSQGNIWRPTPADDIASEANVISGVAGRKEPVSKSTTPQTQHIADDRTVNVERQRREETKAQEPARSRAANHEDSGAASAVPLKHQDERKLISMHENSSSESCAACQVGPHFFSVGKKCEHTFCVTCIQSYFSNGESACPACGIEGDVAGHRVTQPLGGRMLVTHDSKFKLPGHEGNSRGTLIVTYTFPAGVQSDDMVEPGRRYANFTQTAFFPDSSKGSSVVELLELAFEARILFHIKRSKDGADDKLRLNGICHKTSVFGGPQMNGYPDPIYLMRVSNELMAKGLKCA